MCYILFLKIRSNSKIRELLYHDHVTGRWSYEKFRIEASGLLKDSPGNGFALLYIDVERFKYINDTYGYMEGDHILMRIAELLRLFIQPRECFARVFADNFVILVRYADREELNTRICLHRRELESIPEKDAKLYSLGFCGSIYYFSEGENTLFPAVDRALYAKDSLRGSCSEKRVVYDEAMRRAIAHEKELESLMKPALANNEFVPYFQAKVDICNNKITGAEALVRVAEDNDIVVVCEGIETLEQ